VFSKSCSFPPKNTTKPTLNSAFPDLESLSQKNPTYSTFLAFALHLALIRIKTSTKGSEKQKTFFGRKYLLENTFQLKIKCKILKFKHEKSLSAGAEAKKAIKYFSFGKYT
jgi:hypothetical protein